MIEVLETVHETREFLRLYQLDESEEGGPGYIIYKGSYDGGQEKMKEVSRAKYADTALWAYCLMLANWAWELKEKAPWRKNEHANGD